MNFQRRTAMTSMIILTVLLFSIILSGCQPNIHHIYPHFIKNDNIIPDENVVNYSPILINGIDWNSVEPAPQDDFEYQLNDNGGITIIEYTLPFH